MAHVQTQDSGVNASLERWGRRAGHVVGAGIRVADVGLKVSGVVLAASGLAHFVAPRPFIFISKPMFPDDTEKWVQRNGAAETAIGLALISKPTRAAGFVGLIVYGVYLGDRLVCYVRTRVRGER